MDNKVKTKKQHYIPQVYLRGFSPKNIKDNVYDKKTYTIYMSDINKNNLESKEIGIQSACQKECLYELKDKDGKIVFPNYYENLFSELEKKFGKYRSKLENKVYEKANYRTNCFLTKEEKAFWMVYIISQILRIPETLKAIENLNKNIWNDITDVQVQNITKEICLFPFNESIKWNCIGKGVYEYFMTKMAKMSFCVCVDVNKRIVTANMPVYITYNKDLNKEFDKVIFPISSGICLYLIGNENKKWCKKNCLYPVTDNILEDIIKSMAEISSNTFIYSNHELTYKEKMYIKDVRKTK